MRPRQNCSPIRCGAASPPIAPSISSRRRRNFAQVDTIEGRFALGNAQAQNHAYEKAIKAYDEVLKAQPDNVAAKTNRAIVVAALKAQEEKRRKQEQDDPRRRTRRPTRCASIPIRKAASASRSRRRT